MVSSKTQNVVTARPTLSLSAERLEIRSDETPESDELEISLNVAGNRLRLLQING